MPIAINTSYALRSLQQQLGLKRTADGKMPLPAVRKPQLDQWTITGGEQYDPTNGPDYTNPKLTATSPDGQFQLTFPLIKASYDAENVVTLTHTNGNFSLKVDPWVLQDKYSDARRCLELANVEVEKRRAVARNAGSTEFIPRYAVKLKPETKALRQAATVLRSLFYSRHTPFGQKSNHYSSLAANTKPLNKA